MKYPLVTNRLSIGPLTTKDIQSFVAYRQDIEIARYQSWEPSYSEAQALKLVRSQESVLLPATDQWLQLSIHNLNSSEHVGDLALHRIDETTFEVGFTIARGHQRMGYAREAVERLLVELEKKTPATLVIAQTDVRNQASIATLGSLGFSQNDAKTFDEDFKGERVTVLYFQRELGR